MARTSAALAFMAGAAMLAVAARSRRNRTRRIRVPHPDVLEARRLTSPRRVASPSLNRQESGSGRLHTIVLTGGPCAGKTSAMSRISSFLRQRGFRVFVVPEAATMLFGGGISFADLGTVASRLEFQTSLLKTQMLLEDCFVGMAREQGSKAVVLCDRGAMDGSAYMARPFRPLLLYKAPPSNTIHSRYNARYEH